MSEYRVMWVIDVDADSPRDAALMAKAIHMDRANVATFYDVIDISTYEKTVIDTSEVEEEEEDSS